jgi:hypothetical protein
LEAGAGSAAPAEATAAAGGGAAVQTSSSSAAARGPVLQQLLSQQAGLLLEVQQALIACEQATPTAAAAAPADAGIADQQQDAWPRVPPVLVEAADKLAAGLQAFGLAVAVQFPAAVLCCNPACVNLQGSSEAALLGPGSRCSGCKVARFCSKECSMEGGAQGSLQEAQGSRCSCCGDLTGLDDLTGLCIIWARDLSTVWRISHPSFVPFPMRR